MVIARSGGSDNPRSDGKFTDEPLEGYVRADEAREAREGEPSAHAKRPSSTTGVLGCLVLILAAAAPLLGGLGIFGWQVLHFLRAGTWEAVSVIDALRSVGGNDWTWTVYPQSWVGVWRILDGLPASVTGVVLGIIAIPIAACISAELARENPRR